METSWRAGVRMAVMVCGALSCAACCMAVLGVVVVGGEVELSLLQSVLKQLNKSLYRSCPPPAPLPTSLTTPSQASFAVSPNALAIGTAGTVVSGTFWTPAMIKRARTAPREPLSLSNGQNCAREPSYAPVDAEGNCVGHYFDGTTAKFRAVSPRDNPCCYIPFEHGTFVALRGFLTPESSYIDFGTWVGPMLMYAAQHAKRSWGFEADPVAFENAVYNVGLNPFKKRVTMTHACMDGIDRNRSFYCSRAGSSACSLFKKTQYAKVMKKMDVLCFKLTTAIEQFAIPPPYVMKIDCEGCEYAVFASIHKWLSGLAPNLPSIVLSTHATTGLKHKLALLRCIRLFPFVFIIVGPGQLHKANLAELCVPCDYYLSRLAPPTGVWNITEFSH